MSENELIALLRLQKIPNIGDIVAKKLIERSGSATAIFEEKPATLQKIEGIGAITLKGISDKQYLREAESELDYIQKNSIRYRYYRDNNYPNRLKHCIDGPILLFESGNISLEDHRVISIVGTRNMTSYGKRFCEDFIESLAPLNPVIVSGFAYGVDITAHRAAMDQGLQTVGCLAHGLNQIYPKTHKRFVAEVERNGGFFTEFWSTNHPERENFLKRNRIIAGLSEATIVVESAEKGGSLVTADLAHGYNRDVFAVPGRATDAYSVGCNTLIKQQKAQMITTAADMVYLLGWQLEEKKPLGIQKQLFVGLEETEQQIYTFLQANGKQLLDNVALGCGLPIFKTSSTLLTMEMKGVVRPLPGKLFEAV